MAESHHILDARKKALAVSLQVCRDRRAFGMLQLSREKKVRKVAWPVIGYLHLADATLVSEVGGRNTGKWGRSERVEKQILEAGQDWMSCELGFAGLYSLFELFYGTSC
jgi:hypothetical protein